MNIPYLIYRTKYRFGKHLPLTKPVDVSLELSSVCNMACSYCYHASPTKLPFKKGLMNRPTIFRIIEQAANLGVHSLKLNWKGESTLNPHFAEAAAYGKSLSRGTIFVDRLTNSNFKFITTRDDIFEGLCNQTKVKVSLDSFDPQVFENQRRKGNHSITMANIDKFYNYPKRKNTELVIQAVRTKLNKDEDIYHESKKRWPDAEISIRDMVAGRVDEDVSGLENKTRDISNRQSCIQAHTRIIFNHLGNAFPCCPDVKEELKIGNIWESSLSEIFNSIEAKGLRRDLKSGKAFESDPCKSCSSFETFKGFKPSWNS